MPSWGQILQELQQTAQSNNGVPDFDGVRRKYLVQLHQMTGRPVILYSSDFLNSGGPVTSITLGDMQGLMEVVKGLPDGPLDLILHSPGGSAEAADSILRYLRTKFDDIRVFVPLAAMSAATMWALGCDLIVMGKHSQLGPIDPQLVMATGNVAARSVIKQFEQAKKECAAEPALLGAWLPILQQYGPALIQECERADKLARRLVRQWLRDYMFNGDPDATKKARRVGNFFADYGIGGSHALGIDRVLARSKGVLVDDLETDQKLQDTVLSVHHATMHTFNGPAVKIIENHLGNAFVQQQQAFPMPMAMPMPIPQPPGP